MLFDVGSRVHRFEASRALLRRLRECAAEKLELVVISHTDDDHHNLLELIQNEHRIGTLVAPRELHWPRVTRLSLERGTLAWDLGRVRLEVRSVALSSGARSNDRSLLLTVTLAGRTLLLFGDQGWKSLSELLPTLPRADLVLWPHHGRDERGRSSLLARTKPRTIFVSDAVPRPFATKEAAVYDTARHGALRFSWWRQDDRVRIEQAGGPSSWTQSQRED